MTRTFGVIAATALTAVNAFLLPPGIVTTSEGGPLRIAVTPTDDFSAATVKPPTSYAVKLACGDCTSDKNAKYMPHLDVTVTTLLNGFGVGLPDSYSLYPPLASYLKPNVQLTTSAEKTKDVQITADQTLVSEKPSKDGESLITITYQISSVDHSAVTVAPITITALKGTDNALSILEVETEEPKKFKAPTTDVSECNLPPMLCHFREVFASQMSDLKKHLPNLQGLRMGCTDGMKHDNDGLAAIHIIPGHVPGHRRPGFHHPDISSMTDDEKARFRHHLTGSHFRQGEQHGRHGQGHRYHGHGGPHHGHWRNWSTFVRILHAVVIILIPIMLGVTMGIVVSLIGMIVGRLVSFVWIRFVRGGKRGYASVRLDEDEAEAAEGKDAEANADAPPMYEDVPEYTEKPAH